MAEKQTSLRLVRDVFDSLLVDNQHRPIGRADGIVIVIDGESQPRVAWIETGIPVLARRIGPRFSRQFGTILRHLGIRRGRRFRIAWSHVKGVGAELKLDLDADRTPALACERWIAQRIFAHIPGGKAKE